MVSPAGRRAQVRYAMRRRLSCRRACALLRRPALDAGLSAPPGGARRGPARRAAAAGPAASRATATAGSGRSCAGRDGRSTPNASTGSGASAGWRSPGGGRGGRCVRARASRPLADRPNAVWTYDFIHDAAANGLRFKCLTVVDEYTRECLAITVERSLPARRVLEVLAQLVARYGPPGVSAQR